MLFVIGFGICEDLCDKFEEISCGGIGVEVAKGFSIFEGFEENPLLFI